MNQLRDTPSPRLQRRTVLRWFAALLVAPGLLISGNLTAMDRLDRLMALFRRRWACPIMAELDRAQGAKFVSLVHALGANAGSVRQALDELIDLGWIRRNPGYGHPLRPEYILTRRGERLAPACGRLEWAMQRTDATEIALRKWSMPALFVIGPGPARFTQVAQALDTATDRAVSIALKDLSRADLIARELLDGPPPGSIYLPTRRGEQYLPILDQI
ncbi:MAG: winged helix-turn-helix transcriptional regulator [Phycisphaerales bacterium]|nr:winged helix-turn-helix transcriptional regulator [Phycisphaerales bacterium]